MRAYFFTNMYLSSLQQGLQSAHCTANIYARYTTYSEGCNQLEMLRLWSLEHQTIIILNGGFSSNLIDIKLLFDDPNNPYPHSSFKESCDALNNALTCVGIVVPERIYEGASFIRRDKMLATSVYYHKDITMCKDDPLNHLDKDVDWIFTEWEIRLMKEMNKYGLAR